MPWQRSHDADGDPGTATQPPWGPSLSSLATSSWQLPQSTGARSSPWGSSVPARSVWQSVQSNCPCTEEENAAGSTYTETSEPFRVPVRSGSW